MFKYSHPFILGIKGVAMANLAVIFKQMGCAVQGADVDQVFITDGLLHKYHIPIQKGFDPKKLPFDTDCFIYSAAHQGTQNLMAQEAKKRSIPLVPQAEILADLLSGYQISVAVSGCHGKTTTSSLLSYALMRLGENPAYCVGSPSFSGFEGGHFSRSKYCVIEADEYGVNPPVDKRPKLLYLDPTDIICTNIDFDHPDVYRDLAETIEIFRSFFDSKSLVVCGDDRNLIQAVEDIPRSRKVTYGFDRACDYRIADINVSDIKMKFSITRKNERLGTFETALFGEKNASNVAAVIAFLHQKGFSADKIKIALSGFAGAKRRFELKYAKDQKWLFDDYAHHPKEIETIINAARMRYPGKRVIVIFQPHTFSRTQTLMNEFASSLSLADHAFVLPIFPSAREDASYFTVTSEDLVRLSPEKLTYVDSRDILLNTLSSFVKKNDVVFTMGAGDVYEFSNAIMKIL